MRKGLRRNAEPSCVLYEISGGQYAENVYAALLHCSDRNFRPAFVLDEKENDDREHTRTVSERLYYLWRQPLSQKRHYLYRCCGGSILSASPAGCGTDYGRNVSGRRSDRHGRWSACIFSGDRRKHQNRICSSSRRCGESREDELLYGGHRRNRSCRNQCARSASDVLVDEFYTFYRRPSGASAWSFYGCIPGQIRRRTVC